MAVYTAIDDAGAFFQVKLYVGDGSTQSITGVGLQPDFIWIKNRTSAEGSGVFDTVRGVTKMLCSQNTDAESTDVNSLTAFGSDGFSVGTSNRVNQNTNNIVAWDWKGGTTSIPAGSTSDPAGVSYNATSGFGIYKITAPASGNYALKHGLGTAPDFIWVKDLDAVQKHLIWSDQFSNLTDDYLQLNSTAAKATYSTCWSTMSSTDATIATGGILDVNNDHIIYVFSNRQGFSKFGSYTGNGSATSGTFIYTGFRPAFVMAKLTSGAGQNWLMWDNKRNTSNAVNTVLYASANTADTVDGADGTLDFLSNGFKFYSDFGSRNGSGSTYVYIAFAEAPFVNSSGVPCNAR